MQKKNYPFKKTICYLRKSRADMDYERKSGEDTLKEQEKLMVDFLNDRGIKATFKKEVASGDKIEERPIFKQIVKDLENGIYDSIAVKEISRLGRGSFTNMGIIYDMYEAGLYIITPYKTFDPNNSSDAQMLRFEMFMSKEEYEIIKRRLYSSRIAKAKQGRWMSGNAPYGYKTHKLTKRLEIDNEKAKVVKYIYYLYIKKRYGYTEIRNCLKALNIKSPKGNNVFDDTTIADILENDAYIGTSNFATTTTNKKGKRIENKEDKKIIVKEAHKPIISIRMFNKAQEIRKDKSRLPKNAKSMNQHDSKTYVPSELTSLMVCSKCGKKLIVHTKNRKNKNETVLVRNVVCKNNCQSVKYETALEGVLKGLEKISLLNENELEQYFKNVSVIKNEEQIDEDIHTEEIEITMAERQKELEEELFQAGEYLNQKVYTLEEYMRYKSKILEQLEEVKLTLNSYQNENNTTQRKENIQEKQVELYTKVYDLYKNAKTEDERNKILLTFFNRIELKIIEKGTRSKQAKIQLIPYFNFLHEIPKALSFVFDLKAV